MLLHQFPDLQWLKAQANTRFTNHQGVGGIRLENSGWPTVVLNTKTTNAVRDNIRGPLSIFTNLSGNTEVTVEKRRVTVTPETFFISNTGQSYTLEVQEKNPTETFNIHFGERFIETALPGFFASPDQLLDNTIEGHSKDFGFHNRLVQTSTEFRSIVDEIRTHEGDALLLEEKLFQLLSLLLNEEKKVIAMHDNLTAVKSTTKDEILKRLTTATDYLYTYYTSNPGLDELAQVSCLSKFHFLRLFKMAYGQSPHQFIMTLKVNKGKELLRRTSNDVKSIAHQLGFDSSSAFSRLFYNQTGVYPSRFRAPS